MRAAPGEPGGGGIPMMPVRCRQADWLPCPGILLDTLRGVVSNRSTNKRQREGGFDARSCSFRDDCMDVEWNEARMDEGVTDGHSHNSFRSDTHEEIREMEIEYSWRNYGNN